MSLGENEKIQILLHEYDSLRQEILNRTYNGFQLFAVGAVLFVLITPMNLGIRFWIAVAASAAALLLGMWVIFRDIGKAAGRIRELEKTINVRAEEQLLVWETKYGGAVTGYIGLSRPLQ